MKFKVGDKLIMKDEAKNRTRIKAPTIWHQIEIVTADHNGYLVKLLNGKVYPGSHSRVEADFELDPIYSLAQSTVNVGQYHKLGTMLVLQDPLASHPRYSDLLVVEVVDHIMDAQGLDYRIKKSDGGTEVHPKHWIDTNFKVVSTSIGSFSSSQHQVNMNCPSSVHKYDVGDEFEPLAHHNSSGNPSMGLKIVGIDKSFALPHYHVIDNDLNITRHSSKIALTISEDYIDKNYLHTVTQSKARAMRTAFNPSYNNSSGLYHPKMESEDTEAVALQTKDATVSALQSGFKQMTCSHPNKYINGAADARFWVCPDCKADLGDA